LWILLLFPPVFLIILILMLTSAIALLLTQYYSVSIRSASAPRNAECLILFHFFSPPICIIFLWMFSILMLATYCMACDTLVAYHEVEYQI